MEDLCRLCGKRPETMICIFDESNGTQQIRLKITKVLQIEIDVNDTLPKRICSNCNTRLDDAFQFINYCHKTQNHFEKLHCSDVKLPHDESTDYNVNCSISPSFKPSESISSLLKSNEEDSFSGNCRSSETHIVPLCTDMVQNTSIHYNEATSELSKNKNKNNSSFDYFKCNTNTNEQKENKSSCVLVLKSSYSPTSAKNKKNMSLKTNKKNKLKILTKTQCDVVFLHSSCQKEKKVWTCSFCRMTFTQELTYQEHLNVHTGNRPFICKLCKASFRKRQELNQHRRTVHSEKQFKCSICDHIAKHKGKLTEHMKSVHEKPFACDLCSYRAGEKSKIQQHIANKHNGDLIFMCEICGTGFRTRASLQTHRMNIHFPEPKVCQTCGIVCPSLARYNSHVFRCGKEKKRYPCENCGKSFVNKNILKDHMNKHLNIKPYKCDICGKDFYQRNRLDTHKYVHRKPAFQCEVCNQTFNRKDNMKNHMKKHFYKPIRYDNTIVTAV